MDKTYDAPFSPELPQPFLLGYDPADPSTWDTQLSLEDQAAFKEICADRILFVLHIARKYVQLESARFPGKSDKQILVERGKVFKTALEKQVVKTPEELGKLIDHCFQNNYLHMQSILKEKYRGILLQLFDFIVQGHRFRYYICRPQTYKM